MSYGKNVCNNNFISARWNLDKQEGLKRQDDNHSFQVAQLEALQVSEEVDESFKYKLRKTVFDAVIVAASIRLSAAV